MGLQVPPDKDPNIPLAKKFIEENGLIGECAPDSLKHFLESMIHYGNAWSAKEGRRLLRKYRQLERETTSWNKFQMENPVKLTISLTVDLNTIIGNKNAEPDGTDYDDWTNLEHCANFLDGVLENFTFECGVLTKVHSIKEV